MMRFSVQHTYPIAAADFYRGMFFDDAYNQTLYLEGLGFEAFTIEKLDRDETGLVKHRTAAVRPRLNMPKPVRKLLGDAFTYREVGTLKGDAWHSEIVPSRLADKVTLLTVMRVEAAGVDTCERIADFEVEVRLFGLGKVVERFIEKTLRESYEKAAAHSRRWLDARR